MSVLQTFTKLDPLKSINARIDPLMNMMGAYGQNAPTPFDPVFTKMGAYGYKQAPADTTANTLQPIGSAATDTSTSVATSTQQQAAAAAAQTSTQKASTSGTLFGS